MKRIFLGNLIEVEVSQGVYEPSLLFYHREMLKEIILFLLNISSLVSLFRSGVLLYKGWISLSICIESFT